MAIGFAPVPAGVAIPPISGAVGTGDHESTTEVALQRFETRVTQHADAEWQQNGGDGHVRDPHRQRCSDRQEPQQHTVRASTEDEEDIQDQSCAEPRTAEARRENEHADEEGDDRIPESGCDNRCVVGDSKDGDQQQYE